MILPNLNVIRIIIVQGTIHDGHVAESRDK